jgi:hypothetical protein
MATAATSSLGKAREHLKAMIAASTAFQTWVGATGEDAAAKAAAAAGSIWYESLPLPADSAEVYSAEEVEEYWPYALLFSDGYQIRPIASESWRDGGTFGLQLVGLADEDAGNDPNETTTIFENAAMTVLEQMADLFETAGYLNFTELQVMGGPVRSRPDDIAAGGRDELAITVRIPWGE